MEKERKCRTCGAAEDEVRLKTCIMCHKFYCEDCVHYASGRQFCSRFCADYFFFGDEEENKE